MPVCRWVARVLFSRYRRYKWALFLYIVTFLLIFPFLFFWNPNSPYYKLNILTTKDQRVETYKRLNDKRKNLAYHQLSRFIRPPESNRIEQTWSLNKTRILITLITTARLPVSTSNNYRPQYLTQTVARLLDIIANASDLSFISTRLLLCDVDKSSHREAQNLDKYVDSIHQHSRFPGVQDGYEAAKLDYIFCLNNSLLSHPDYTLVVEDDALAHHNLLGHLEHLVLERIPRMRDTNFGFIKLYHPNWLNGYITADVARLAELLSLALLLTFVFGYLLYGRLKTLFESHPFEVTLLLYLYCILCLLAIGRINVNYFRSWSPYLHSLVPAPSCCIPANFYSSKSTEAMIRYLSKEKCYKGRAIDTVMDKFAYSSGMKTWLYDPKLFDHIGVFSSRHSVIIDPSIAD